MTIRVHLCKVAGEHANRWMMGSLGGLAHNSEKNFPMNKCCSAGTKSLRFCLKIRDHNCNSTGNAVTVDDQSETLRVTAEVHASSSPTHAAAADGGGKQQLGRLGGAGELPRRPDLRAGQPEPAEGGGQPLRPLHPRPGTGVQGPSLRPGCVLPLFPRPGECFLTEIRHLIVKDFLSCGGV